jgi:hypothetical protein
MFDKRHSCLYSTCGLWLAAFQSNPTEALKAASANSNSRGKRFEIAIEADQNSVIHFTYCRDQWIRRIWCELPSKKNHFMARVRQRTTYRIRNAMVDKELDLNRAP